MPDRSSNFLGLLALALAIVIFGFLIGGSLRHIRGATDNITVTGSAKRPIRSDYVVWRGALSSQNPTLQEAAAAIKRDTDRFRALLSEGGMPDSAVTMNPLETYPIPETVEGRGKYGGPVPTGRIVAYSVRQPFEIRGGDVKAIVDLADRASRLISEGIRIESQPLEYLYTRLPELRTEMLSEAAADAKHRAESIAGSVGSKIGAVRSARMGVFQITARNSTQVADYGIYDTSSLEKDITAVVSVTFTVR